MRPQYISLRRHIAGVAIAVAIGVPVSAKDGKPASAPSAAENAAVRIDNFGRINERYYRGALPDARRILPTWPRLGVKTTIDLTNGDGDSSEQQLAGRPRG